jgi:hypothetical protein
VFTNKQNSVSGPGEQTLDVLPRLAGNAAGGYGGAWPAYIWHSFMTAAFGNMQAQPFPAPDYAGFTPWFQVDKGSLPQPKPTQPPPPMPSPSASTCTNGSGKSCRGRGFSPPPIVPSSPIQPSPTASTTCVPTIGNPCTTG